MHAKTTSNRLKAKKLQEVDIEVDEMTGRTYAKEALLDFEDSLKLFIDKEAARDFEQSYQNQSISIEDETGAPPQKSANHKVGSRTKKRGGTPHQNVFGDKGRNFE